MNIQTALRQWSGSTLAKEHRELGFKAAEKIDELQGQVQGLQILLNMIKKDLLLRSDTDENGNDVVNLSHSIWLDLKEAVAQFNKQ